MVFADRSGPWTRVIRLALFSALVEYLCKDTYIPQQCLAVPGCQSCSQQEEELFHMHT